MQRFSACSNELDTETSSIRNNIGIEDYLMMNCVFSNIERMRNRNQKRLTFDFLFFLLVKKLI